MSKDFTEFSDAELKKVQVVLLKSQGAFLLKQTRTTWTLPGPATCGYDD
jgi:hypothetical protein